MTELLNHQPKGPYYRTDGVNFNNFLESTKARAEVISGLVSPNNGRGQEAINQGLALESNSF